jgi:hypothetical protein
VPEEVLNQEPDTTQDEESVYIDYSNVDFSNTDEDGKLRNFEEVLVKPDKQENTAQKETQEPEKQENQTDQNLDTATDAVPADFGSMENFSDIQKHMEFLTQDFDDTPDLPGESVKDKPKTPEEGLGAPEAPAVEPEKPFQDQYLEQVGGVKQIFAHYLKKNDYNWEAAEYEIDNHFRVLAQQEEQRNFFEKEKEDIKREREALGKQKEVEASRPTYNQNMYQIAQEKGWKNSQQLHDYMYDKNGGGELMLFLFHFKNPDAKFLDAKEYEQQWKNFNVEFGSNKKNLEFAEKQMRKIFVANNYTQALGKRVKKELATKADLDRAKKLGKPTTKTISKTQKQPTKFSNWLQS